MDFAVDRELDIILLGRIAVDFNPVDYFQPLEECTTFKKYVGGSPANIAIGVSRHGLKAGFIARVSDDQLGDYVTHVFEKEGIDVSNVVRCTQGEKIGLTFTEILSRDESSILMYRNMAADLQLGPEDVNEEYIKKSKSLLISGTALAQSPSREAALKAMYLAKRNNVRIIFDIDYRSYSWKSEDEISIYYSIVAQNADIIMGSREEFNLTERLIEQNRTDEQTAKAWIDSGAQIVVIKHGKSGSTAFTSDGNKFGIKPFPVEALKGFGGGDGYASAFIYGIFKGMDIEKCLEFGSAEAAMMVREHSSSDLPNTKAVEDFISETKAKYGEMIAKA
ncbi:5-dehydro-2-deoxygluconokinase [Candidatus Epulonipiscium fishelsonii]|uniref:5-dehydro-2-deoxygluconokinase n=1 Tax=Candidatus Epulonipiscium fishelsonii TaxID=77094 RepID=A0ACC8XEY1_9FIRM|nr:5-dehydro-2-deoxygluconokinase [Epulopiscium sp. SCG-B11WGA-EpuloA1]ONI43248.1 5-dehydro-2-deoxygluconokinase [Epulopiscium sp. SCG-B05WGA-EpuloA1]ONI46885.1 5-dehydro-2-deoxygluconokinase [Epulopiscium sp. SCG-C06WGA-EpuloA1]